MNTKQIDLNKSVYELCSENPELPELLAELGFKDITKPGMLPTVGRFMTISKGAMMKKIDLNVIRDILKTHGYEVIS